MTGRTVPCTDGHLAEVFRGFPQQMPGDLCTTPGIIALSPLSLATDVTDVTLGASSPWLEIWTRAGGSATLA